jgi:hypothetical protein
MPNVIEYTLFSPGDATAEAARLKSRTEETR